MNFRMRLSPYKKLLLLVLFILTACSIPESTPSSTAQSIATIHTPGMPTQTSVKTTIVAPTVTTTPTMAQPTRVAIMPITVVPPTETIAPTARLTTKLSTLPAGQYLVYWGSGGSFCGLKAVSETREEFVLADMDCSLSSDQEPILSGNGLFLLLADRDNQWLYDLADGHMEELAPSSIRNCMAFSVSWNGKWLAGQCGTPEAGFHLAIRSIDGDWTRLSVFPPDKEERIAYSTWSPDGKMLAFSNNAFGESEGVYIIDADSCLEYPSTCTNTLRGPYGKQSTNYLAWSPDGTKLLLTLSHKIYMYHVESKLEKRLVDFSKEEYWLHGAAWSADGKRIGYARDKNPNSSVPMDLYLIPADGGSPIFLTDQGVAQVVAWLRIDH